MRTARQRLGDAAEDLVATQLVASGWTVLARNVRVGRAELDLLAIDPGPPIALVVLEVRWRSRRDYGLAEETVDQAKRRRVRAAAFALLDGATPASGAIPPLPRVPLRFDLVAVEPGRRLRHHRAAF